mgnify:CR=1 FL=1
MPNKDQSIESIFNALSDPTRLSVIEALSKGSATVSELARYFTMALPSFTQHLGVLERAGLLISKKEGRQRICTLNPKTLKDAEDWLAIYRQQGEERMDRFEAHLAKVNKEK